MCRRLLTIFILSVMLAPIYAKAASEEDNKGLTAEKCFKEAPGSVLGLIAPNTRLDMIDYYSAGIDKDSQNTTGGPCRITDMQDYSITFTGGNGIEYQMFVLNPNGTTPVIGLIQTIDTPIPDSQLILYRTDWNIIPTPNAKALGGEPDFTAWVKPAHIKDISTISEQVPFVMAKYTYHPETSSLTAQNNMDKYFVNDDTPETMSMLKDTITYKWQPKAMAFFPEK